MKINAKVSWSSLRICLLTVVLCEHLGKNASKKGGKVEKNMNEKRGIAVLKIANNTFQFKASTYHYRKWQRMASEWQRMAVFALPWYQNGNTMVNQLSLIFLLWTTKDEEMKKIAWC